jgi:hypothetical protein
MINGVLSPVFQGKNRDGVYDGYVVIYPGPELAESEIPSTISPPKNEVFRFGENSEFASLEELFATNTEAAKGMSAAYSVLLDGVPSQAGFRALIETSLSTNFGAGAGPVFNEENIFINLVNNLVQGNTTAKATFDALATGSTLAEKIGSLYIEIIPGEARTVEGLAFLTRPEGIAFYQQVASERGVAGDDGAAIIALASLLRIAVSQDIGIGNAVNDLVKAVAAGSHAIPETSTSFTDIELADGTQFDIDDGPAARASEQRAVHYYTPEDSSLGNSDPMDLVGLAPDMQVDWT